MSNQPPHIAEDEHLRHKKHKLYQAEIERAGIAESGESTDDIETRTKAKEDEDEREVLRKPFWPTDGSEY